MVEHNQDCGSKPRKSRLWMMLAGGTALGAATAIGGLGINPLAIGADDGKPAVKADDKKPNFKPEDVHVGPPPELAALRKAIEEAAKKGENVDDIRAHMDKLEKAMVGRAWVRPNEPPADAGAKANPMPPEIVRPGQRPRLNNPAFPRAQVQGFAIPFNGGMDQDALRKLQEMMKNFDPQDDQAMQKMLQEQQEMLRQAIGQLNGQIVVPGLGVGPAPIQGQGRLGIRLSQLPAGMAEKLELPAGRGMMVSDVVKGSAAEKAGFKSGDVIVEFAGKPVTDDPVALIQNVRDAKTGNVDMVVIRDGKKETLHVKLPEMKNAGAKAEAVPAAPFVPPAGANVSSMSISMVNGEVNIQATDNGVEYTVKGRGDNGKMVPNDITIKHGDKTVKAESMDKVPAEYREKIEAMISGLRMGEQPQAKPTPRVD